MMKPDDDDDNNYTQCQ